jgi:hypothetical protein
MVNNIPQDAYKAKAHMLGNLLYIGLERTIEQ